jgi:hypothetical protein
MSAKTKAGSANKTMDTDAPVITESNSEVLI